MIESDQAQGENINVYPEVSGPIDKIFVAEGQAVRRGDALVHIDDSVQRASAEQEEAQADAALATLHELKAQPRPESLAVARAQVENARASLKNAQDQLAKQERSFSTRREINQRRRTGQRKEHRKHCGDQSEGDRAPVRANQGGRLGVRHR